MMVNQKQRLYLTKSKDSWVDIFNLPKKLSQDLLINFDDVMALSPKDLGKVVVRNKEDNTYYEKEIFRSFRSYGKTPNRDESTNKSHMFSGLNEVRETDQLPEILQPILDFATTLHNGYNQSVVNWYKSGDNHIEMHSDCDNKMVRGYNIFLANLTDSGSRVFSLVAREGVNSYHEKVDIKLKHGQCLIMGGRCQQTFRHGVLPDSTDSRRCSVTFRMMEE